MKPFILVPAVALAACVQPGLDPQPATSPTASTPSTTMPSVPPPFVAAELVRQQWAKAENKARCAPVAFTDTGNAGGTARAATFSGGWAVAFDLPGTRSAYGVAGPGLIADDDGPP